MSDETKTDPPAELTPHDKRELALQQMRSNLYAAVFQNCPGKKDEKTKAAKDALEAFDGEAK